MKIEVTDLKKEEIPYPCIMKSKGSHIILLATEKNGDYIHGTILDAGNSKHKTGEYSSLWNGKIFELFKGKITLSNNLQI